MKSVSFVPLLATLALSVLLQSCHALPRLEAVPPDQTEQAIIPGIPNARFWLDRDLDPFVQSVIQDFNREEDALARPGRSTTPIRRV
jgi:hypothetical protein